MKKATLRLCRWKRGGARALDGTKIRAASQHEPVVVLVCMCVCAHTPHVYFYEADTSITYSSVLSAGLPHCVFQHASQSLCHMHYLTLTLTLMHIAAEIFLLDILTYLLERFSHRLWQSSAQISLVHLLVHFTTYGPPQNKQVKLWLFWHEKGLQISD